MDNYDLFSQLLHAEHETEVETTLQKAGLFTDDEATWHPLGFENNFAAIGNQQSDPTAALIEKIINSVDAVLMAECYSRNIDPEGADAPQTMAEAIEQFFDVRDGRIENLTATEQTKLASKIHLVAVGKPKNPSYLIIDQGEGQTPAKFPNTFLSLLLSNKMRIPFVQGKFNSGGTGVLQFCGEQNRNYQLIVSKRHPNCPIEPGDTTGGLWGFTIVRRLLPTAASKRRNSMYVYLTINGKIPTFKADGIKVMSAPSKGKPDIPYAGKLTYGTCIKLYNYRWRAKSTLTTEGRYELERFLHWSCVPFRISETRKEYSAHSFNTTVTGGWIRATSVDKEGESTKLESGFPAYAELNLPGVGHLPYQIAVFKRGTDPRHIPNGIFFLINGQVHGSLPSDFVSRKLKLDYLKGDGSLLVSVDCTYMEAGVREDFFMSSRDRVRKNEVYVAIEDALAEDLKNHPGLQEINQQRRKEKMESHLNEAPLDAFQRLIDIDPTLSILFGTGGRLVTGTGPAKEPTPFDGKLFPTYFHLSHAPKGGLVKTCPVDSTCRIEFETDAKNDYFERLDNPGRITIDPPNLMEHQRLWNGHFETRFRVPWDARPGDLIPVTVTVTDIQRDAIEQPFVCTFTLRAAEALEEVATPGRPPKPRAPTPQDKNRRTVLELPNIREIHRKDWAAEDFNEYRAVQIKNNPKGGYDFLVNVDNAFLLTELSLSKEDDKPLAKFWFSYGLVLSALGMIKHSLRLADTTDENQDDEHLSKDEDTIPLDTIAQFCDGLAQVIIPIIRTLSHSPVIA